MTSEIISVFELETETANDFTSSAPATIYEVVWWGEYFNGDQPDVTAFNLRFYTDAGGIPGDIMAEYPESAPTETIPLGQGSQGPVFEYHAAVSVGVGVGTYWFSVQACDHEFPPEWGRLSAYQVTGYESMLRSVYFGFPDWTRSEDAWGAPLDASQRFITTPPIFGACCFADLHCEFLAEVTCTQRRGLWQGGESGCDPNPCSSVPMACCFPDGRCEALPQSACHDQGGLSGVATSCDASPCPMACCFRDGHCEFISESACRSTGGNPQGVSSTCDPNPCPQYGACCNPATGRCTVLREVQCTAPDVWMGNGTACAPNPCPQPPTGACCNPTTGSCSVTTQAACGDNWQGAGTTCTPNLCPQPPGVSVYYVRADGNVPHSPPYFPTIQAALDYANLQTGDVIELIGTPFTGAGNRAVDFHGRRVTVRSQGGDPDQCVIDCQSADRGFIFGSGEDNRSVLEALTVANGEGTGISISSSSPWIRGCKILHCNTPYDFPGFGGGMSVGGSSSPLLTNCTIDHCGSGSSRYGGSGGGIGCNATSHLTLTNCIVSNNGAGGWGGGNGGGIWCGNATFSNCIFNSNSANHGDGGGVYCESGTVSFSNCEIRGNVQGGVVAGGAAVVTMERCVITGNETGVALAGTNCAITNCTIAWNLGYGISAGGVQVLRSILWGNCPWDGDGSGMIFTCCDLNPAKLSGQYTLNGPQVETDPIFCAPASCEGGPTAAGDYQLNGLSPCLRDASPCHQLIGALDVGCYPASAEDRMEEEAPGLMPGRPNPFVDETAIVFGLAKDGVVDVAIYDVGGRCVRRLASQTPYAAGTHQLIWRRSDDAERLLPAGVYMCRLRVGGETKTNRLVVLR